MNLLVVGDVHGCYYTFKTLVKERWNPDSEFLIQVGDLVNKGQYSAKVIRYAFKLLEKFPYLVYFIRGNHEQMLYDAMKANSHNLITRDTYQQIKNHPKLQVPRIKNWLKGMPVKWENRHILITHAGVARGTTDPFNPYADHNVLTNRQPLKLMSKLQVVGHVVQPAFTPTYVPRENAWHIDTGAYLGQRLSALRITYTGELLEVIQVDTDKRDLIGAPSTYLPTAADSLKYF
ncbi:metallophosphoesterase [Schleiferia thermophila]|jgi:serine/threonine protein phosphatase 1|uniref:Serine/threonine protein phosphatase 1 n=1 Tax=Schleiferia thermophila TaxID=884107 RepID=A0A369A640_9FLAO|nr:metallophosphoesterase [Schleiferia thermophila]KFD38376.1 Serine/threonine-protein phosphatase 1 [Schleiferia thermophila str. Yellowstone]RCX04810.1 serine/threonine protein phosphatase 1 [Schleiferia thermophila]GCD79663.1 serine/threonine protein phosphatase [Schleiferia thermophila]